MRIVDDDLVESAVVLSRAELQSEQREIVGVMKAGAFEPHLVFLEDFPDDLAHGLLEPAPAPLALERHVLVALPEHAALDHFRDLLAEEERAPPEDAARRPPLE